MTFLKTYNGFGISTVKYYDLRTKEDTSKLKKDILAAINAYLADKPKRDNNYNFESSKQYDDFRATTTQNFEIILANTVNDKNAIKRVFEVRNDGITSDDFLEVWDKLGWTD